MPQHAYDRPDIGPVEFLFAVMSDPTVHRYDRLQADAALKMILRRLGKDLRKFRAELHYLRHKRPLDYQPPPPRKHHKAKVPEPTSRYEWLCLIKHREYWHETGDRRSFLRERERVLIRNPERDE
jgi:hypothetical protein